MMDYNKLKINRALFYGGIAIEILGFLVIEIGIIVISFVNAPDIISFYVLITGLPLMVVGCIIMNIGNVKLKKYIAVINKKVYANIKKYNSLPYCEIENYGSELDATKNAYYADLNENKNKIKAEKIAKNKWIKKSREDISKFCDYGVLKIGKIYYGYCTNIFFGLNSPSNNVKLGIIKVIYSTDNYINEHPDELKTISERLYDSSVAADEFIFLNDIFTSNYKLPAKITNGRDVYITSIIVNRAQLPTGYISNNVLPIIAMPENSSSVFVVDCKYWSNNFIGNFAYRNDKIKYSEYTLKTISRFSERSCGDYSKALESMRERFISDRTNAPVDLLGENPFPSFEFSNIKLYYASILDCNSKKHEGEPYVGIYSTDNYFKSNPKALKAIADKLKTNNKKIDSVINYRKHEVLSSVLSYELTDARTVIITAIFINKQELPTFDLIDNLLPVVHLDDDNGGWLYSLDCKYWGDGFTYEYVNTDKTIK